MDKKPRYFPIKTDTACQLKWAWSTVILPTGTTQSCHRVEPHAFDVSQFNFHNTVEKIQQRETMLMGKWPAGGCNYCQSIETTGKGQSDREFFLNVPNISPPELESNLALTTVFPTILEVYVDNTCNLKCLYCIPEFSSRIDNELRKFGKFEKNGLILESTFKHNQEFDLIQTKFWEWMDANASTLVRLHLLGGEPFYQKQFDKFIEFFQKNPCPQLEFNIITNLMLPYNKLIEHVDTFKSLLLKRHIKRVEITASIDCWGPQQEYVRYGLNLDQWQKNFEYLIDQKWIKLNINNTVSVLTIKTLPALIEKLNQWNKHRKIEHYFDQVQSYPTYMAPNGFLIICQIIVLYHLLYKHCHTVFQ